MPMQYVKPINLYEYQSLAQLMLVRVKNCDLDAYDRFDAYLEQFWNDEASLEEAINDMMEVVKGDAP